MSQAGTGVFKLRPNDHLGHRSHGPIGTLGHKVIDPAFAVLVTGFTSSERSNIFTSASSFDD